MHGRKPSASPARCTRRSTLGSTGTEYSVRTTASDRGGETNDSRQTESVSKSAAGSSKAATAAAISGSSSWGVTTRRYKSSCTEVQPERIQGVLGPIEHNPALVAPVHLTDGLIGEEQNSGDEPRAA